MMGKYGSLFFFTFLTIALCFFSDSYALAKEELLKVVVISRHGARSPIQTNITISELTEKQLPHWTIKKGNLTSRGSLLVSALWEEMYDTLGLEAFFPKNICPKQEDIYVYANTLERTQATAVAILNGLVPGCKLSYSVMSGQSVDPLFIPDKEKEYNIKFEDVFSSIKKYYGDIDTIQASLKEPLQLIADTLGPCSENICKKYSLSPGCTIIDIPNKIIVNNKGKMVDVSGCLSFGKAVSESFLLGMVQWPDGNLSELKVTDELVKKTLSVHSKMYELEHRIPEVAKVAGSPLLDSISTALISKNKNKHINKAKLVIFVGHDLNIVTISSLLSLNWQVGNYPPNEAALGGFLAFSLWKTPKGNVVRVHYVCQTLDTLLNKNVYPQQIVYEPLCLTPSAEPNSRLSETQVFECSEEQFINWVKNVIDEKLIVNPVPLEVRHVL